MSDWSIHSVGCLGESPGPSPRSAAGILGLLRSSIQAPTSSWVFLLQKHPHLQVDAGAGQVTLKDPAAESPARGPGRARAAAVCGSLCEAGSSPRAPIPVTWGSGALLIRAGGLRSTAEKDRLPAAFVALLCHPVANLRPQHAPRPPQPPPFQVFP